MVGLPGHCRTDVATSGRFLNIVPKAQGKTEG